MPTAKAIRKQPHLASIPGGNTSAESAAAIGAEGKFRILFEQASDAILTLSPEGTLDEVNQTLEEMTGYVRAELTGQKPEILSPTPEQMKTRGRVKPFTHEMLISPGTYEDVALRQKDGFVRLVELSVRQVRTGNDTLALVLLRDVTEKKRMERELITKHSELRNAYFQLEKNNAELKSMQETLVQAGKMAALGELAAGIAHELNQPLQGIRGYAQELQDILKPVVAGKKEETETTSSFHEIISNVDKMASIIQYLRAFTRKSVENFEKVDVHNAIEEALKMLSRQFASRGIQVHRDFAKELPQIYANPLQIEQVFINLSTNARDAIEAASNGSGNIWISTRDAGNFVEISFKDDGCGMDGRTKSKIFNPFFTTKEVGKGMGLGLSLSYGMLTKIHASIVVESELGKGARFLLRLPKDFREIG